MQESLIFHGFRALAEGLDHPECVAWGPDGYVYAGGEAGQIYRVGWGGDVELVGSTGGFVLGLCLDADANVYACDTLNAAIMRVSPAGEVSRYFGGEAGRPLVGPNYAVFDDAGNLFFSESGEYHKDNGRLWVVRPDGQGEVLRDDVRQFPNGAALDAAQENLYVVLSTLPGVVRVPLAGGPVETVAVLEHRVPDGVAFDADGGLYVSCYTPDELLRVGPDGEVDVVASDWERNMLAAPTNLAFCGPDLGTLVVANLGRWHLTAAESSVRGQPCSYPRLARAHSEGGQL
jgi:gluconolactonase